MDTFGCLLCQALLSCCCWQFEFQSTWHDDTSNTEKCPNVFHTKSDVGSPACTSGIDRQCFLMLKLSCVNTWAGSVPPRSRPFPGSSAVRIRGSCHRSLPDGRQIGYAPRTNAPRRLRTEYRSVRIQSDNLNSSCHPLRAIIDQRDNRRLQNV